MVTCKPDIERAKKAMVKFRTTLELTRAQLDKTTEQQKKLNQDLIDTEKARIIVQNVANELQKNLEYRIANLVTMALSAAGFDYEFKVEFVTRRNQTEVDLFFTKAGNDMDPVDSSGGGAIDIASMALRMAVWSLKKTRAIQILDEPCKFLSRDMQSKASEILKELSKDLGIQLIIISHIPEMIEAADRIINVTQTNEVSQVKILC